MFVACNVSPFFHFISFRFDMEIGQPGIRSRFATLTILVPPEPPKIIQGDFLVTTEDREIELECISVGGKPAAEVNFPFSTFISTDTFQITITSGFRIKKNHTMYSTCRHM